MAGEVLTKLWDSPGPVGGRPSQDHLLAKGALVGRSQQGTADTASEPAGWAPRWLRGADLRETQAPWGSGPGAAEGGLRLLLMTSLRPRGGGVFISGLPGMGKGC